jgi:branched-chain amino acid aminotransferase
VIRANNLTDAYVRPIAWRGSEQMGVAAQHTKTNVAIAAWDWGSYFDPAARAKGLRLAFAEFRRPDPRTAPVKSKAAGLYMICTIEKHRAERQGYNDALSSTGADRSRRRPAPTSFSSRTACCTHRRRTASSTASRARP